MRTQRVTSRNVNVIVTVMVVLGGGCVSYDM